MKSYQGSPLIDLFLAALAMVMVVPSCSAEDIRIRLVNGQTGELIKGRQPVALYLGRDHSGFVTETTNTDGVAVFRLPDPLVEWVTAGEDSQTLYHCSPYQKNTFATAEILHRGAVALNNCDPKGKLRGKIEAKPGEVVIFARPLHWWEKGQW